MKVYTVAVQKGGVGKTTTTAALAQAALLKNKKVLAIDLDPQGNLSFVLGAKQKKYTAYDLFNGVNAAEIIQIGNCGVDIIPAGTELSTIATSTGSARRLNTAIEPLRKMYDYIFIDTPATTGELHYNAMYAADEIIIPLNADILSAQGLSLIQNTINQIRKQKPGLKTAGVIITDYDGRSTLSKQLQATIIQSAKQLKIPYLGTIRKATAIKEAQTLQQSLFKYAPECKPAQDYLKAFEALTN